MKKIIMAITILCSIIGYSQETDDSQDVLRKNEFKINMTNLIIFKWVDVSYERVLNEESTFGVGVLVSLDPDYDDGLEEYRTFSITPYYRHFFSKKYAQGFFVEGFGMLHSGKDEYYIYSDFPPYEDSYNEDNYTDFAIGISAGAKFVTKRGFVAEIYLGIGRDLLGNSDIEVVGRGGIAIGYRF